MANTLTAFRVFIASPSGLERERRAFRATLREYNEAEAIPRGFIFLPVGWEDTLGGVGRPQSLINEEVRACDFFVQVLWNRWGSPTDPGPSTKRSGTEEEFQVALECLADESMPMRQLVLMFKAVPLEQLADPGPQLREVLDFRAALETEKKHLFETFDSQDRFRLLLRRQLAHWLRRAEGSLPSPAALARSSPATDAESANGLGLQEDASRSSVARGAWELADQGRLTEAEEEFARLVIRQSEAAPLLEYGRFLVRVGRVTQARTMFERAVELARSQNDNPTLAKALLALGNAWFARRELDQAELSYREALVLQQKLNNTRGQASAYGNLGLVLRERGDLPAAEAMQRRALALDEIDNDTAGIAATLDNLASVRLAQGELEEAEGMRRRALAIEEGLQRPESLAASYGNLATVLAMKRDFAGAATNFERALAMSQTLGHVEGIAIWSLNLGNIYFLAGRVGDALRSYRSALVMYESLEHAPGIANASILLANVMFAGGDLELAEQMYRRALDIDTRIGRLVAVAEGYNGLANVSQALGNLEIAAELRGKADEILARVRISGDARHPRIAVRIPGPVSDNR